MKLIIFIIFIIFCLNLTIAQVRPRCITTKNIYDKDKNNVNPKPTMPTNGEVKWWYLNQLANQDAIYTDSSLQDSEIILEVKGYDTRNNKESPLYNTYIQSFQPIFHSITYNDAVTDEVKIASRISRLGGTRKKGPGSAHSKGFFIWNENGGIHVIHSFPKSPTNDTSGFVPPSANGDTLSQHAMCIELPTPNLLEIIPKYLIYSNSDLHTINNQRLHSWVDKPCYVSLSLVPGIVTIKKQNYVINSRTGWDFNGVFNTNEQATLNGITNFGQMETFLSNTILQNPDWKNNNEIGKWKLIALKIAGKDITSNQTLGNNVHYFKAMDHGTHGRYFVQTSNGFLRANYQAANTPNVDRIKYEIIWKFIKNHAEYSDVTNWISHTMTSEKPKDDSLFKTEAGLDLVYKFQSETEQVPGNKQSIKEISTTDDHSKLLYGSSIDNKYTVFCVGDLNWQGVQILRGGGAFCRTDLGYLVDFYQRRVSWLRSQDAAKIPNKFGILNSLFTTRSTFNLDWIGKEIKDEYNLDGSHLNEIRPDSNVKASFKLSSDYKSMLKLKVTKPTNYQETVNPSVVKTEPFSLNVYPSIEKHVFICPLDIPSCDYETSVIISILKQVELPVSYIIKDFGGTSFANKNMAVEINVTKPTTLQWLSKEELQNLVKCASIAKKYVYDVLMKLTPPAESISLIRNIDKEKDTFKGKFIFPLSKISFGDVCNNYGTGKILFNEDCQDLLYLCLYHDQLDKSDRLLTKSIQEVIDLLKIKFGDISKKCLDPTLMVNKDSKGQTTAADAKKGRTHAMILRTRPK